MAEKTVPWWRRAWSFAFDGIRSGFGLFPRSAKLDRSQEQEQPEEQQPLQERQIDRPSQLPHDQQTKESVPEIAALEEDLEEETALPKQPANPPTPAADAAALPEPVPAAQPAAVAVPLPEPVPEPLPETAAEPAVATAIDPVSVPEPVAAPPTEPAPEPVIVAPEPVVSVEAEETAHPPQPGAQPEPVAEIAIKPESEPEPESESEPEPEPVVTAIEQEQSNPEPEAPAPAVEPAAESRPEPQPADAFDAPPPIAQAEFAPEIETEAEPEDVPAPEPSAGPVEESSPEPAPPSPLAVQDEQPAQPAIEPQTEPAPEPSPLAETQTPPAAEIAALPEPAAEATPTPEPAPGPVVDEKAAARLAARQKRLDEADEESPFSVIVDKVYDGPLDLLLDLIRKQDIDIYDIPIAKITAQFLAYVNQLKASDVDVAGEFIYTASLLIHIKSRMLLPRAPSGPDDTPEDPRRELVERLLEHERFKNAAQMLQQKQMLEAASWTNPGAREFKDDDATEPEIAADTVDLVRIFRDILERARTRPVIDVTEDSVTVGQMIQFLARRLTMEDKPVALRRLLSHNHSERALIAMFLALLELVRLQAILLRQDRQFSEIFIKKHTGFDTVMNEGLANARDDWR